MEGLKELFDKVRKNEMADDAFEAALNKILPRSWKPASVYNELSEKYKTLEKQNAEFQKAVEEAGRNKVSVEEMNKTLDTLKQSHKAELEKKDAEFARFRRDAYIDGEIQKAGAKTAKAVRALVDLDKIAVDGSGAYIGLKEQLDALKSGKDTAYLFAKPESEQEEAKPSFGGGGFPEKPAPGDSMAAIKAAIFGH